jgi:hypothetical protein
MKQLHIHFFDGHDCSGKSWASKRFECQKHFNFSNLPRIITKEIWLAKHYEMKQLVHNAAYNDKGDLFSVSIDRSPLSLAIYQEALQECKQVIESYLDCERDVKLIFEIMEPDDKHYFFFLKDKCNRGVLDATDILSLTERKILSSKFLITIVQLQELFPNKIEMIHTTSGGDGREVGKHYE